MRGTCYCKHPERAVLSHVGGAFSLHRLATLTFIFAALLSVFSDVSAGRNPAIVNLSDTNVRRQEVERLAKESQKRKANAIAIAQSQGLPVRQQINDTIFELMAVDANRIYVYKTCNVNAAISIGADLVRNTPPYDVNGEGLTVGIWDGGAARATHQELVGRVTIMDGAGYVSHSTHVAGTVAAAGVDPNAQGMAPSALINSYEWNNDVSEMTSRAMSYPNEPGKIQLSNHSYGYICGWDVGSWSGSSGPHWFGTWGERESDYFGIYASEVVQWDQLCYNAPYYLPVKASGNDRSGSNNMAPADGTTFWYEKQTGPFLRWRSKTYDSSSDPYDDNWDNGGFDTIMIIGVAKNIMTVGGVYDAVTDGVRDINEATMTSFSGWGPTDDGRVKPDIVTNGTTVYSSMAGSNSSYGIYTGTSVATPGAVGAATLLLDYYGQLFPGQTIRSSTLKALIIHSADDLGNAGPDYKFGWGLLNAKAAADRISDHHELPDANRIAEGLLDDVNSVHTYTFECGSAAPIKATLCWTDPPASAVSTLDDPSPRLLNDLDLRIIDPNDSETYYPYVLNPANPSVPATTGDNTLDNVEQVLISSPNLPGNYTVQISYKGTLTNGQQYYSLIFSAASLTDFSGNGSIGLEDLSILSTYWLQANPSIDIAPPGGDGIIDLLDYTKFAQSYD